MKYSSLLIFFLFILQSAICQRPMDLNTIESKLDSISEEADFLYAYNQIKEHLNLKVESSYAIYLKSDTFHVITSKGGNVSQFKLYKKQQEEGAYTKLALDVVDSSGIELLHLKQKAFRLLQESNLQKTLAEPLSYDYAFSETEDGFNYYAISSTDSTYTFPLDTNYVFQFDQNAKLLRVKHLPHQLTHVNFDAHTEMIILVYDKNSPLIYATDLFKFKQYCLKSNIELLDAYSISSRRKFIYHPKNNQIDVK